MNITDVGHLTSDADTGEDKMLKGAGGAQDRHGDREILHRRLFADCDKLNIKRPDVGGACDQLHQRVYPHGADLAGQSAAPISPGQRVL